MNRKLIIFLSIISLYQSSFCKSYKKIAITQIISHPSLNKVLRGIKDGLRAKGFVENDNLRILYKNANGSIVTASQIATSFAGCKDCDLAIAITTPSAQTLNNTISGKFPVVFSSVTDPVRAGLIKNPKNSVRNITGVSNPIILGKQVEFFRKINPKMKNMGLVINPAEENSIILQKNLESILAKYKIKLHSVAANNSSEVHQAATNLIGKVDSIMLLQDNTVASAIKSLMKIANKNNIPVFSTYAEVNSQGVVASLAYDEYDIGYQTGELAVKVLEGKTAVGVAIERPKKLKKFINEEKVKELGLKSLNEK